MIKLLGKIFGTDAAIKKGGELIDDLWTSKEEEIEARTSAKVELLKSAAPFKISQRIIAWSVTFTVLLCFLTAFGITIWDFFTDEQIRNAEGDTIIGVLVQLLDAFKMGWAWTAIIMFYFGSGLLDSAQERWIEGKNKKDPRKGNPDEVLSRR